MPGAIPGSIPPVIGWVAGGGGLTDVGAIILFGILFLWQMPHFLAIAWLYREDYARAGLLRRGVEVSEIFHFAKAPAPFGGRVSGIAPGHISYGSLAAFQDPDGNGKISQTEWTTTARTATWSNRSSGRWNSTWARLRPRRLLGLLVGVADSDDWFQQMRRTGHIAAGPVTDRLTAAGTTFLPIDTMPSPIVSRPSKRVPR